MRKYLVSLGIVIDADEHPPNRWQSIRNACLPSISDLPAELPSDGLIHTTSENIKFGIWIMPDNQLQGMLETFLAYLLPDNGETLWQYTQTVVKESRQYGALFTDAHFDKAHIHTWLAWQKEPGRQLHQAVSRKILQPDSPKAQVFVKWFRDLYDV